ncbi:hypothetical protein SAMN05444678_102225 [Sphingomonas sp. YR710]|uniref:hypothetical protein n=1 Tax=Sphingomonas sp. YR710 TaxID=1882773 RepID=UPI000890AA20|nr:hypothetical protein [Sphingomonas sp. YR710]SDC29616.1 hypothetical protein SAMN05444678_102225 [Sphingomonas sp. YR710]
MRGAAAKSAYPGKVAIRHVIETARDCGLDVAGIEVSPDGTIRVVEARALPKPAESEFDRCQREGLI